MHRPTSPTRPLIVIPAWNEVETVGPLVAEVTTTLPDIPVVVVDDGSSDGTAREAAAAGATVLPLAVNLGVGGAMRAGFRYAMRHGFDAVVQVDADGQHDPREVPALLAALDEADLVIGARFAGAESYPVGALRRLAMGLLAMVLSRMAHTRLTDTTSGFRAAGPRALALFARVYPVEYLGDTVESLIQAVHAGLVVRQVPVRMRERAGGTPSQPSFRAVLYLLRAGLVLALALVRRNEEARA
jgi:glycosyltransferase involved in cell wall biosynthesis